MQNTICKKEWFLYFNTLRMVLEKENIEIREALLQTLVQYVVKKAKIYS